MIVRFSERSRLTLKPRFPRLSLQRRRREADLNHIQSQLEDLVAEHRQAGHGWFTTADQDGMVRIRPT